MKNESKTSKRAVFVLGHKGGTGKTLFARALLDRYQRDQTPVVAYDGDGEVGQLIQYYGVRTPEGGLSGDQPLYGGIQYCEMRKPEGASRVIDALDHGAERLLFDLPGGIMNEIASGISDTATGADLIAEYRSAGYAVTIALVLSPVLASAKNVMRAIREFGADADYVVVLNAFFGQTVPDDTDFLFYYGFRDGTGTTRGGEGRAEFKARGGIELVMPMMRSRVFSQIDADSLSFDAAQSDPRLVRSIQRHITDWVRRFDTELDKAGKLLGL